MNNNQESRAYLFVLPWSITHVGGVNQVVLNLAEKMHSSRRFTPIILISDWSAVQPVWEEVRGLKTVRWRIRPYRNGMSIKDRIIYYLWSIKFNYLFKQFCYKNNVVAVNPHFPDSATLSVINAVSKINNNIRLFISFHGADITDLKSSGVYNIDLWRDYLTKVDYVVVCSQGLGEKLIETFGHIASMSVIHNGVNEHFKDKCLKEESTQNGRIILSVGKYEKKKGQEALIRAFSEIVDEYDDIKLVLVGAKGNKLQELKNLVASIGIQDRVAFYCNVNHDDICNYYRKASLFVLPSLSEPFGIVILEAGLYKLPVIASRVGGIPEIITSNINGLLYESGDVNALVSSIKSLLDSEQDMKRLGNELYHHVLSKFTWDCAYKRYTELVEQ